tara:strand:+ start:558 stop:692 length:135 start_codon:yes stop_codon:yes gene_type:complete
MINKSWLCWLLFVIIWNYGWPEVNPIWDVVVAVFLSLSLGCYKK